MACYVCGVRQTDPVRGPSTWKRLVRQGEQVLVCPDCSTRPGWDADADRCPSCGSRTLSKSLGMLRCRGCGSVSAAAGTAATPETSATRDGLSDDVTRALDRIFGRGDPNA